MCSIPVMKAEDCQPTRRTIPVNCYYLRSVASHNKEQHVSRRHQVQATSVNAMHSHVPSLKKPASSNKRENDHLLRIQLSTSSVTATRLLSAQVARGSASNSFSAIPLPCSSNNSILQSDRSRDRHATSGNNLSQLTCLSATWPTAQAQ